MFQISHLEHPAAKETGKEGNMNKRLSAARWTFIIPAFVLCASCIPIYHKVTYAAPELSGGSLEIAALQMNSGERLTFSKKELAFILGDKVVTGYSGNGPTVGLPLKLIKSLSESGGFVEIETTDGRHYAGRLRRKDETMVTFTGSLYTRSIPLTDITLIWVSKINWLTTSLVSFAVDAGIIVAIVALTASSEPLRLPSTPEKGPAP